MNDEQLHAAIYHLIETEGLVLPYNVLPGSKPGGIVSGIAKDEANWVAYNWRSPHFLSHLTEFSEDDTAASDKPTYASLMIASGQGELSDLRMRTLHLVKEETRRRVILAYGANSFDSEIMLRLRGDSTTLQDTERDRLRAIYSSLKATINSGTMSQIQTLDIRNDTTWASN